MNKIWSVDEVKRYRYNKIESIIKRERPIFIKIDSKFQERIQKNRLRKLKKFMLVVCWISNYTLPYLEK